MSKKFLSFLGTNNYEECTYYYNDKSFHTKYVQYALVNIFCNEWNEEDEVIIFTTKDACEKNWYDNDNDKKLKNVLCNASIKPKIKNVFIPDGKSEEEIWGMFEKISNEINEGDEVILDITCSFRSIPMLSLVSLNYAKVLKNIKLLGIYYGAFEARNQEGKAPIFDLTVYDQLLEWSQAVNTFIKYGSATELYILSKTLFNGQNKYNDEYIRNINGFINKLNDFTKCIYTCRGQVMKEDTKNITKKSIYSSYESMNGYLEKLDELNENLDNNYKIKPFIPLLKKIKESTEEFNNEDNLSIGMAVTKWSITNNLTQQAYTALDETIKTYVCKKFKQDEYSFKHREAIVNAALNIKSKKIPENKWKISTEVEQGKEIVKKIVSDLDEKIIKIYSKTSDYRNDINHFGFRNNLAKCDKLQEEIEKLYEEFEEYVNTHHI